MKKNNIVIVIIASLICSCTSVSLPNVPTTDSPVSIYPDYKDVTVPINIAPLNFSLSEGTEGIAELNCGDKSFCYETDNGSFHFSEDEWKQLTSMAKDITVTVCTKTTSQTGESKELIHPSFTIHVSPDSIEPYVVYRRIVPGYHKWNKMGLYQRSLETFEEIALIENKDRENACVNCHTFLKADANHMVYHQRAVNPGTFLITPERSGLESVPIQPELANGAQPGMVYPAWHPSGNFIAFSTNKTVQDMHVNNKNRLEVFDSSSSIQIYDIRKNTLYTTPLLSAADKMNTFPTFTPDGKKLVYCSADSVPMPDRFRDVKYNIVAVDFDAEQGSVGDTCTILYNAVENDKSALFPRFSPDGTKLLFTISDYGTFPIWHHEADLRLLDLNTNVVDSLDTVNSDDTDSFHTWSQNNRWVLFSSRREDGLFTRLYITHIDAEGKATKPFLLPQEDANDNKRLMQSYNVPELVKNKIEKK